MSKFQLNTIVNGDCLEELKIVPSASTQLVIADPPYNLGPQFGNKKEWNHDSDWISWCNEWLSECHRILQDDGNIFVYGIHHYLCYLQVQLYELGFKYRRQIIWNYENGFSSYKRSLATHYEPILWFSKSGNYAFSEIREPYKSQERLKNKITKNGKIWIPHPDGRIAGDVWAFPTLAGKRFSNEKVAHPTQKPLSITGRIINHFSQPGQLVVVPFVGSGTECVSAFMNERNFWGCELNSDYIDLANSRLKDCKADLELLRGNEP